MLKLPTGPGAKAPTVDGSSFLPEDYVERRNETRASVAAVALFIVVTLGVVGAFLVTHREWNDVKAYQTTINVRYTQAAQDIEQLKTLEKQKLELLEKAELTTALLERVPRSILLAELINRMPEQMVLLEFDLESTRVDKPVVVRQVATNNGNNASFSAVKSGPAGKDAPPPVMAPEFETEIVLVGVTPTHRNVAQYVAALQECALLTDTSLVFSESTVVRDTDVFRFRVEATITPGADARSIEPVEAPRAGFKARQVAPEPADLLSGLRSMFEGARNDARSDAESQEH